MAVRAVAHPATSEAGSPARGQTHSVLPAIFLTSGASCLRTELLAQQIAKWAAGRPVPRDVEVHVVGDELDPRVVSFWLERGGVKLAERHFRPGPFACVQLQSVVALSIAIALRDVPPLAEPSADKSKVLALEVGALLTRHFGTSMGFGADIGLRHRLSSSLSWRASLLFAREARERSHPLAANYDMTIAALSAAGCASYYHRWLMLGACTGPALGASITRASGLQQSTTAARTWPAWLLRVETQMVLHPRLALTVGALAAAPFRHTTYKVRDEVGEVVSRSRTHPVGVAAMLGFAVDL